MSPEAVPFILVCPQCGKRFAGDPAQPNAQYRCPDDQNVLKCEESKPVAPPAAPPTPQQSTAPPSPDDVKTTIAGPDFNMDIEQSHQQNSQDEEKTRVLSGSENEDAYTRVMTPADGTI